MLTLTLNPSFGNNQGGITLSGTVSSPTATVQWRWVDEETFQETYVRREGVNFSIDFRFSSNEDAIIIQAIEGVSISNNIPVNLATGAIQALDPSFRFNEFDELGIEANLERIPAEDNETYRDRLHRVYTNPGSSTKTGLAMGVERDLGLPPLTPFFSVSTRWDPRTNKEYKKAFIDFSNNSVTVQLKSYVKQDELVDVDPVTHKFTTVNLLGSEFPDDNTVVVIRNGDKILPSYLYTHVEGSTFKIQADHPDVDVNKVLTITYPYKMEYVYKRVDPVTKQVTTATVADVRQWLRGLEYVVDENSQSKPLITWIDGRYETVTSLPAGAVAQVRESIEHAFNDPTTTGYVQVLNDPEQPYYYLNTPYVAKGFFSAPQILDTHLIELSYLPVQITGSWIISNEFHDKNFISFLETTDEVNSNINLARYANELRDAVRMGMSNTLVNHDYWGSDAPEIIGDNFMPALLDGGIQTFKSLSAEGSIVDLSLNRRKFYAKQIASGIDI